MSRAEQLDGLQAALDRMLARVDQLRTNARSLEAVAPLIRIRIAVVDCVDAVRNLRISAAADLANCVTGDDRNRTCTPCATASPGDTSGLQAPTAPVRNPAYEQPAHLDDRGIDVWLAEQARMAADPAPYLERLARRGAIRATAPPDDDPCDWPEQPEKSL